MNNANLGTSGYQESFERLQEWKQMIKRTRQVIDTDPNSYKVRFNNLVKRMTMN